MQDQHLTNLRHSAEHVLQQALKRLYPQILIAAESTTDEGFYVDFDASPEGYKPVTISEEEFPDIEKRMREIIDENLPIAKLELAEAGIRKLYSNNQYKQELIEEAAKKGDQLTVYITGKPEDKKGAFAVLCKGSHVNTTGEIKAFKLLSVAGAYWGGDEKNKMLTRIYGTAFFTKQELDDYLMRLEEAKKRDHRKLGKDLDLFAFSDLVGKGLPLFTEKGATIWRELERYVVDEEIRRGYKHVKTPNIAKTDLYRTSGHYPYYKDTMYPSMKVDEDELILRPMTCPHHFALYMSRPRSYRELPIRYAEMANLFRYEKSGELTGLIRVRQFTLADSHNFVRKDQAADEINVVLDLIEDITKALHLEKGTDFTYRLSLGDRHDTKKYYDAPKEWEFAEECLRNVLKERDAPFYEAPGEAAFYGPKIDVQMKNVLGKEDTAFTVQYDFCLPKRFSLVYTNEEGHDEQPVVIHRSSIGALERVIGFLIEHYAGALPVWLSPVQVAIIPIAERHNEYAHVIAKTLQNTIPSTTTTGIRTDVDDRNERMQAKIRQATLQKIPYIVIIGDEELKTAGETPDKQLISIRTREGKNQGTMNLQQCITQVKHDIESRQTR